MRSMLATAVAATLLAVGCLAQTVPIPSRPDGYRYPPNANATALVQIDAYFDLMCPDCLAAWPVVKSVLGGYAASDVAFTFHTFPLPYHHHAFTASEGAHVVASSGKPVYDWLEAMFANQPSFGNSATANMTWNEVDTLFGNLAESTKAINIPADQFVASVNNPNFDEATRVSWKLSCARGVSGTPTFFVNGALSTADESWTVAQWKQLIDQLLG